MSSSTLQPAWAVRLELARALAGIAIGPFRILFYLATRTRQRAELRADMQAAAPTPSAPDIADLPARPLRIFISCAEASGEIHAVGVVAALRAACAQRGAPSPEFRGLGGPRLAAAGVACIADPVSNAAMGFEGVLAAVPRYLRMLRDVATCFREWQPDVVLPVDSPALHLPMANIAKRYGLRNVHFVTPQYWGWAPWRVHAYGRAMDRALTILPFEARWFGRYGVAQAHVGHPLLDALATVPGSERGADQEDLKGAQQLVLLPGSRRGIIDRNLPWMLRAAQALHAKLALERGAGAALEPPEVLILQESDTHAERIREHIAASAADSSMAARLVVGDLHAGLRQAHAALSVSGTILIDLLHQRLPTVVIYRIRKRREEWMYRNLLTTPFFASVNLLAGEEVLPEFCFRGEGPVAEVGRALERCYKDADWRTQCLAGLERAAARLGPPGACERAARHALQVACAPLEGRQAPPGPRPGAEDPTQ